MIEDKLIDFIEENANDIVIYDDNGKIVKIIKGGEKIQEEALDKVYITEDGRKILHD